MRFILIFLLFLWNFYVFHPKDAKADIINAFVKVDCNPDLNYLKITAFNINGKIAMDYARQHSEELWHKYQMLSVDDSLISYNETPEIPHSQSEKSYNTTCLLTAKDGVQNTYKITIKGYIITSRSNEMCGGHHSSSISIWQGETPLVDHLTFAPSCKPNQAAMEEFLLNPQEGYIALSGEKKLCGSAESSYQPFHVFVSLENGKVSFDDCKDIVDFPINNKSLFGDFSVIY